MTNQLLRRAAGAALAAALLAAGCGPANGGRVRGKVTFEDGRPVTVGDVILHPDDPKLPSPIAYIEADGSYDAFTEKPGDGVKPGKYRVTVSPPTTDDYTPERPRPIAEKFARPGSSGFEVEVKPGDNPLDLKVHPPR